jgi:glycosyltransferase involved in cell wall biosynthesis
MSVALVVPTHNRLEYTQKAIHRLLEDTKEDFELYLWDNASTDDTAEYLKSLNDPRIIDVYISKTNEGQVGAMNWAWSKTSAKLVGKLDNDCLVTPGWTRILSNAHKEIDRLGAIACWHYPLAEFNENTVRKAGKIQKFGQHEIFRHPWVCGSAFLIKKHTFKKYGLWEKGCNVGTTAYFLNMSLGGEINGWYYPLVLQEHMDDPLSSHCLIKDDKTLLDVYDITYTLRNKKIITYKQRVARRSVVLNNLFQDPFDAKYYVGWRSKIRRVKDFINTYGGQ